MLKLSYSIALGGLFLLFQSPSPTTAEDYYDLYRDHVSAQPIMYSDSSNLYATYGKPPISASETESSNNDYSNADVAFWPTAAIVKNQYVNNDNMYEQMPMESTQHQQTEPKDVCATSFVEHCLMQANSDGEQRLLASMLANRTGQLSNEDSLTREFDGMCNVVIRFIDCLNDHYYKCNQMKKEAAGQLSFTNAKDLFAQSWIELCATDGQIRNNYLQHATCIKEALIERNGQEQCQARFQTYFMSSQFSLDSIERAVLYGCCAFNEWQHCIDSIIIKHCGPNAMKSVQDLIEKASGGLVSSLCDKKTFAWKSKTCMGKKGYGMGSAKLRALDPKVNATLHKYIGIFSDFIDRLPDDEE